MPTSRLGRPSDHPTYPTFADGHDAMLVGEAVARSAREGRWTEVDRGGRVDVPAAATEMPTHAPQPVTSEAHR